MVAALKLLENIVDQTRMSQVSAEVRSRLNTAFVTHNFRCGAVGSVLATVLWSAGGWLAVTLCGAGLAGLVLVVWAFARRGPLVVPAT